MWCHWWALRAELSGAGWLSLTGLNRASASVERCSVDGWMVAESIRTWGVLPMTLLFRGAAVI